MYTQEVSAVEVIAIELWRISQKRKELAQREAKIKNTLISIANHETLVAGQFIFLKEMRKGVVNYKEIPELSTVDLEIYRKESIETWKLIKTS